MSAQDDAKALVDTFASNDKIGTVWVNINKNDVVAGLKDRIDHPDDISQKGSLKYGGTSLCGPADFVRDVASDSPLIYAQAVIDLYATGRGHINGLKLEAGSDLKKEPIPPITTIAAVDWIILASIRDSDNWWFDYQAPGNDVSAITMPHSKVSWLQKAGYTKVVEDTNIFANKDLANARAASRYFKQGYKVCLFINADMLKAATMNDASVTPDHWVGLTSEIKFDGIEADPASKVSCTVYSWGDGQRKVPQSGNLSISRFLFNYYGYIACKL